MWLSGRTLSDALLANYITKLHDNGKSPATIGQVLAAVKWQLKHQLQETFNFPITQATLAGIRRAGKDRGRGQVDGLIWQVVERVCVYAETGGTIAGLRDAAMIRLMSDCLLRISEVVTVNVGDLKERLSHSDRRKLIRKAPAKVSMSVTQHETCWIGTANDLALQTVLCSDTSDAATISQPTRLHPHSARRIIQKRAADAGVEGFISGHSLRVGSAVSLAQAGATVVDMQVAGRWKSSQMPAHYAKAELAERGAIARFKDGKR